RSAVPTAPTRLRSLEARQRRTTAMGNYGFYTKHHYLGDGDRYPGDALIDAANEAIDLRAENERLREALRAAGLAPSVVAAIAKGEPPRPCPAGHGDSCCGYPAACEAALTGRKEP